MKARLVRVSRGQCRGERGTRQRNKRNRSLGERGARADLENRFSIGLGSIGRSTRMTHMSEANAALRGDFLRFRARGSSRPETKST